MTYIEKNPLPPECIDCNEDCSVCEYAGKRWRLSRKDRLLLMQKSLLKAVQRIEKQLKDIDEELRELESDE